MGEIEIELNHQDIRWLFADGKLSIPVGGAIIDNEPIITINFDDSRIDDADDDFSDERYRDENRDENQDE